MIRFLFRLLATLALAAAVIMAVLDATRSVAASALILTPLGSSWYAVSPGTLDLAQTVVQHHLAVVLWDPVAMWILTLPGFAVFSTLALIFYFLGRRPGPRAGRLGAASRSFS